MASLRANTGNVLLWPLGDIALAQHRDDRRLSG
jgi:hypothetical protein